MTDETREQINNPFRTFHACNWEEDYEHENGNYINTCAECKLPFKGHKRRVICKMCAGPNWEELAKKQAPHDNKCAHAGCWGEGEMVGFARCMVKKAIPLQAQLDAANKRIKELEDSLADMIMSPVSALERLESFTKSGPQDNRYEFNLQVWGAGNNNVFITKGDVEMWSGGGYDTATEALLEALAYMRRVKAKPTGDGI